MGDVYQRVLVPKLEQAIADLAEEAGDPVKQAENQRLIEFLRQTVAECREFAGNAEDTFEAFLRDRGA